MRFMDHLERSVLLLYPPRGDTLDDRHARYIESFDSNREMAIDTYPETYIIKLPDLAAALVLNCVDWLLREDRFDPGGGVDHDRKMIVAEYRETFDSSQGALARVPCVSHQLTLSFGFHFQVTGHRSAEMNTSRHLPSWAEEFQGRLASMLARTPAELQRLFGDTATTNEFPHNPILAPGEKLGSPFTGNLLDYSGCATAESVRDLGQGDLPLGRHAFGFSNPFMADIAARPITWGSNLFLASDRTGKPMLYKGALVCAPQNSGKTQLIYRWAVAANRAGYSVFLIDVKGNMYQELAPRLMGKVYHFTSDPLDDDCDGLNFLADFAAPSASDQERSFRANPVATLRVRQLVESILPKDGWEEGEQAYFYQNHVSWMAGLLQILLLYRNYQPQHFVEGEADLSFLYDLARDEQVLWKTVTLLRHIEAGLPASKRIQPGVDYWVNEISLLISSDRGGQRTSEYSYRTLTQSIVNALQPFSQMGTLYAKISKGRDTPLPPRRFFSLESLNDPTEPVTIILAAREQDLDDSRTIVSIAMRKMQHFLFDRMTMAATRPLVLLLDETRRIRGFSPADYITFARQAKAGCVLVYQSLDQIGDSTKIHTILENIGVQIYLGSLVGETARHFIGMLPKRRQATFSVSQSRTSGQASQAVQTGYELVDYFTTAELYRLPAGKWPALVYINDLPRRNPILVDMEENAA